MRMMIMAVSMMRDFMVAMLSDVLASSFVLLMLVLIMTLVKRMQKKQW